MSKKKIFKWFTICAGVLSLLAVLLIGNVSSAFSDSVTGKNSKYSEEEYAFRDLAIKTFDIDTNKVKPLFSRDVFDKNIAEESSDIRHKSAAALVMLTDEGIFKIGDFRPMYFLEGNDKVSIAIKHADGSISLDEFDISKEKTIKIDHKVKEVE